MTPLVLTFPDFDPVAINIFGLQIYWYAIMYLLGFAMSYALMRRRLHDEPYRSITQPTKWIPADVEDVLLVAIFGVLVGGRLGYTFFYKPDFYFANPIEILKMWDGGMSFHGGTIGVILGMAWYAWRKKRPFLQVSDFLLPTIPLGLAAGRFGNFINGELWGREASESLPWAMIFPTGGDVPRHPSQLYQMLLEGILLFIILWLYSRNHRYRGQVSGLFLVGYGVLRFIAEFWREPDAHLGILGLGLSMGQWLSAPMVLIGAVMWMWASRAKVDDREEPVDNPGDNSEEELIVDGGAEENDETGNTPSQSGKTASETPQEP